MKGSSAAFGQVLTVGERRLLTRHINAYLLATVGVGAPIRWFVPRSYARAIWLADFEQFFAGDSAFGLAPLAVPLGLKIAGMGANVLGSVLNFFSANKQAKALKEATQIRARAAVQAAQEQRKAVEASSRAQVAISQNDKEARLAASAALVEQAQAEERGQAAQAVSLMTAATVKSNAAIADSQATVIDKVTKYTDIKSQSEEKTLYVAAGTLLVLGFFATLSSRSRK